MTEKKFFFSEVKEEGMNLDCKIVLKKIKKRN